MHHFKSFGWNDVKHVRIHIWFKNIYKNNTQKYFIDNFICFRPTNLKTLFRPVTMLKPDIVQIIEISLFANGFKNAKLIAKKISKLYKICSEILPSETHYDFGRYSPTTLFHTSNWFETNRLMCVCVFRSARIENHSSSLHQSAANSS